jgi:ABC-2 type transport system ATP-binding protein
MLSTVLRPDRGSFAVAGIPDTRPAEIRRRIGVLPESAGYPPAQTAEEWLVYHARLFGGGRRTARSEARRLLADVGLEKRAGSRIAGLSRGLRQRLGIARALVNNPEVVFLDEPTLGLDPGGQRQVLELVARIARDHGVTVMLSTHTLAEVEQVCNRVVILNRGRIVADGTVRDIMRRAAAPRRGIVQVPAELRTRAAEALDRGRIPASEAPNGRQDEIELTLPPDLPNEESASAALRCLLDAGVPVLGFTLEGGRLSDAFLSVTEGSSDE